MYTTACIIFVVAVGVAMYPGVDGARFVRDVQPEPNSVAAHGIICAKEANATAYAKAFDVYLKSCALAAVPSDCCNAAPGLTPIQASASVALVPGADTTAFNAAMAALTTAWNAASAACVTAIGVALTQSFAAAPQPLGGCPIIA